MNRLGVDAGGTFTDVVTGEGSARKLASRPDDPSLAVLAAVRSAAPAEPLEVVHGTTVATNALLENRAAPVGVLLNRGFRDLLAIGRQQRPDLYALEPRKPPLPTSRELWREVPGRMGAGGEVLEPVDPGAALRAARSLRGRGARALAVVLLHAYAGPGEEQRIARALEPLGLPVSASSAIDPQFREFERAVTTVVNAGLRPVVAGYLERLEKRLGSSVRVRIMTSEGGLLPPAAAAREPARLLVSGPAAGLVAARAVGRAAGASGVLSLDMGGTSTDVALSGEEPPLVPGLEVAGLPVRLPALDIHTVGAGGGSLVGTDAGGALKVGPESAGADPGPAAYGRADRLTVTDAHLLLGHLVPELFAGGGVELHTGHAETVARRTARRLGIGYRDLLRGVVWLADLSMSRALRVITLERGHDPRDDLLVAFGGAGGLHAASLARNLGMKRMLTPRDAGVLSAHGLLWSPPARTRSRSLLLDHLPGAAARRRLLAPMVRELKATLREEGHAAGSLEVTPRLDLRYRGQSYELTVPATGDPARAFARLHAARYGFSEPDRPVELVGLRVTVRVRQADPVPAAYPRRRAGRLLPAGRVRPVGGGAALPWYQAGDLAAGDAITGPALVAGPTGTALLDARCRGRVHPRAGLLVEVG